MNAILFRDLLLNFLLGLTALAITMLAFVNPPVKQEDQASAPGNMTVVATWAPGPVDIDLWVQAPGDSLPIGYSNRAGTVFNLLRDDLGEANDTMPANFENVYSRGLPAGRYVINLHCYSCRRGPEQVQVEVRFSKNGQSMGLFFSETVTVSPNQEMTVVSFNVDANGKVVSGSANKVYVPLRSAKK